MGRLDKAITGALALILSLPGIASSQQAPPQPPAPEPPSITELATQAAFTPVAAEQLAAARTRVKADLDRLDAWLGTNANGQAWRDFLLWEQFQAQVAPDAKPDPLVLEDIRHRLISKHPGMQLPQFSALARSFAEYETAVLASAAESQQDAPAKLEALRTALAALQDNPLGPQAEDAAAAIRWLALRGQAPELVQAVRQKFGRPNFLLHFSEPFLAAGMGRQVNRTEPVHDVIMGTNIHGMGTTSGAVTVQLVPHPNRAVVDTVFDGMTFSNTVGHNGPATIRSAGQTDFEVRKRVYLDPDGIKAAPAVASANTHTNTLGVNAGRGGWLLGGIANNIAAKRVAQSKPQSEAIAAQHAEDRLTRRVDDESGPRLADSNKNFQNKIRYPLLENGQFPADLRLRTTDYYVYALGTQGNRLQLGAPDRPVPLKLPSDLGGQFHQSAINNLADGVLAGDKVTQTDFEKWLKNLLGRLPERFQREPDDVDWIITFSRERPIRITVGENLVTVTLHVDRLEGRTPSPREWFITATYQVTTVPGGLKFIRQGEIDVAPAGYKPDEKLPGAVIGEASNIQRQLGKDLFQPEIIHDGLEFAGDFAKVGKMPVVEYYFNNGWINLAWRKP